MSGGEHQLLLAVIVALGCSRLDVIAQVGEALGFADAVDTLGELDGVTMSEDRVVVDARGADAGAIPSEVLRRAGRAAAERLAAEDELEEVGRIAILAGLPDVMETAVRQALRTEPPRVATGVLRTWRDADVLAPDDPYRRWLEAACASAAGAPLAEVLERYESARVSFAAADDVDAEISVGMAAAVLARRADDLGTLIRLVVRAHELVATGRDEAIPPAVLGDALGHQLNGDPAAAIEALDRFPASRLEGDWAAQVLMMRGTNLMLLDRIGDAVDALEAATGHGSSWTYAVALELLGTARWNAGDRVGAISDLRQSEALGRAVGAVQAAALTGAHLAVLEAADGRPEALDTARRASAQRGGTSGTNGTDEEAGRLLAVAGVLRSIAAGDLDGARLQAPLLEVPTRAVRSAHWTVAAQAALVPTIHGQLDELSAAHPSLRVAIETGRDGAAYLAGGALAPAGARRLLPAVWCDPEPPTVELQLLGAPTVRHDGRDIGHPDWERTRVRELCLHLALAPASSRDQIGSRLWPDLARDAANRNLRVTLTYLLNVLDPDRPKGARSSLLSDRAGMLSLAVSTRLRIDVRDTTALADQIRTGAAAGDQSAVVQATRRLVRIPGGGLLGGAATSEWVEQADEARSEHVLRAGLAGSPVLLRSGHPDLAEALAERGLVEDPWAERLHQAVVRARLARDDLDGARRSLRRALTALGDLGVRPEPATVELARLVGIDVEPR